jgi:hypothetical protein
VPRLVEGQAQPAHTGIFQFEARNLAFAGVGIPFLDEQQLATGVLHHAGIGPRNPMANTGS